MDSLQLQVVNQVLRRTPREVGLTGTLWDMKTLRTWIERFQVRLRVRQCQPLFGTGASGCANRAR
jgi:hypothetical protein